MVPVLVGAMFAAFYVKNENMHFKFLSSMKEVWRQEIQFGDPLMPPGTRLLLDDHFAISRVGLSSLRSKIPSHQI